MEAQEQFLREEVSEVSATIPAMTKITVDAKKPIIKAKTGNGN